MDVKVQEAVERAKQIAKDMIADRCKTDLYYLCKEILGYDLMTERTHGDLSTWTKSLLPAGVVDPEIINKQLKQLEEKKAKMIDEAKRKELSEDPSEAVLGAVETSADIEDSYDPRKKALLLMMPRNTFKSSVVTIGFALQYLLVDSEARVLIDSETYTKSMNFLSEIKAHLEENEKYRDVYKTIHGVYPDDKRKDGSYRWKDSMIDVAARKRKRKEGSIMCSGIDKSINGMHFDLIICDDLHSEKNTQNKDQIEKVIDHWKLSLSLLEPNKFMIVIGTRWDYNDLYQHLLDNEQDRFNIFVRQAVLADGSLFFPEIIDEAFLAAQRRSQGAYMFSCQYMNDPVDQETAEFKKSMFRYKKWDDIADVPINWYLLVDPSYEGKSSDYAALVECGLSYMGDYYVGDVHRMKLTYSGIVNMMFALHQKKKYKRITLETVATQKSIMYHLNKEQKERQVWLPVKEIPYREHTKNERIRGLVPLYETGRVFHISNAKGIADLEDELIHFPKARHDDVSDALANVLEVATPPRAIESEDRKERNRKRLDVMLKPRSPITGI